MLDWLRRLKYRILTFRDYGKKLNACATVEQYLLDCYHGKRELPDREKCLYLSQVLGKS